MRKIMQVVFVALFCLMLAAPAMAIGTMGTAGTHARQSGTMNGTSTSNGYGNGVGNDFDYGTDTRMNANGMNNRNNGDGFGTLDLNNNNNNRNRNGVSGNTTGGNVRGLATDTNNGTDWGWLGLLGLLGLAGMFNRGKDRDRSKM